MSQMLELPDQLYAALQKAASERGMTPVDWIAAQLTPAAAPAQPNGGSEPPRTLADLFAGRVGLIGSGGQEILSENTGERFAEYLEAKRRAGRL